jgi:hypothetical protein
MLNMPVTVSFPQALLWALMMLNPNLMGQLTGPAPYSWGTNSCKKRIFLYNSNFDHVSLIFICYLYDLQRSAASSKCCCDMLCAARAAATCYTRPVQLRLGIGQCSCYLLCAGRAAVTCYEQAVQLRLTMRWPVRLRLAMSGPCG